MSELHLYIIFVFVFPSDCSSGYLCNEIYFRFLHVNSICLALVTFTGKLTIGH